MSSQPYPKELVADSLQNLSQEQIKKLLELQKKLDDFEDPRQHFNRNALLLSGAWMKYMGAQASRTLKDAQKVILEVQLPSLLQVQIGSTNNTADSLKGVFCVDKSQFEAAYVCLSGYLARATGENGALTQSLKTMMKVMTPVRRLYQDDEAIRQWLENTKNIASETRKLRETLDAPALVPLMGMESNPLLYGNSKASGQAREALKNAIREFTGIDPDGSRSGVRKRRRGGGVSGPSGASGVNTGSEFVFEPNENGGEDDDDDESSSGETDDVDPLVPTSKAARTASAVGPASAASAVGPASAASAGGHASAAPAGGHASAASAVGPAAAASAGGHASAASAVGRASAASAVGPAAAASAVGPAAAASTGGHAQRMVRVNPTSKP